MSERRGIMSIYIYTIYVLLKRSYSGKSVIRNLKLIRSVFSFV